MLLQRQRNVVTQIFVVTTSGICSLSDRQSGVLHQPCRRRPLKEESDQGRERYLWIRACEAPVHQEVPGEVFSDGRCNSIVTTNKRCKVVTL